MFFHFCLHFAYELLLKALCCRADDRCALLLSILGCRPVAVGSVAQSTSAAASEGSWAWCRLVLIRLWCVEISGVGVIVSHVDEKEGSCRRGGEGESVDRNVSLTLRAGFRTPLGM